MVSIKKKKKKSGKAGRGRQRGQAGGVIWKNMDFQNLTDCPEKQNESSLEQRNASLIHRKDQIQ